MKFTLKLHERRDDRVFVTVCLSPDEREVSIEGVAVELRCPNGLALGPRLVLPISGPLSTSLALRTELRARKSIPRGSQVAGIAWTDGGKVEAGCPSDPGTALELFARGARIRLPGAGELPPPTDLDRIEHAAMVRAFPWMAHFRTRDELDSPRILEEQSDDIVEDVADCYNLCDEDKELLRELLGDDDDEDDAFSSAM